MSAIKSLFSQDILGKQLFIIDEWALEAKKDELSKVNALNALKPCYLLITVKRSFINVIFVKSYIESVEKFFKTINE